MDLTNTVGINNHSQLSFFGIADRCKVACPNVLYRGIVASILSNDERKKSISNDIRSGIKIYTTLKKKCHSILQEPLPGHVMIIGSSIICIVVCVIISLFDSLYFMV